MSTPGSSIAAAKDDPLVDYLISVSRGRRGLAPSILRGVLGALAPVYCFGLKTYLLPYQLGLRQRYRLPCSVISIGNLTTGGTGKTPMTQALCRLLTQQGRRVAVLSRGYGGKLEHGIGIVSDRYKVLLTAQEAGDEAFLLAGALPGIPVVIGKDRRISGKLAMDKFQPDVIVLDDGMQYWQLHRDLDIVLLNACEPFDNGWTFPRGLLREPPSHLRRAGIVVLTNARRAGDDQVRALIARVRELAPGKPVFTADLAPDGLRNVTDGERVESAWLEGRRVTALSAIGNPASFESMIGDMGGVLAGRFRLRDHQKVTQADLDRLSAESAACGAEAIITTEKDAVKMIAPQTAIPLLALQVTMQLDGETDFVCSIDELFSSKA